MPPVKSGLTIPMKTSDRINYRFLAAIIYPLSILPLRLLYVLADAIAWCARVPIGYRRKVIRSNIESSFPDLSRKEHRTIERRFYHFLADYGVETIKLLTMSREEMARRLTLEDAEPVCEALRKGRNVSLLLGHYCNWEWVSSLPMHFPEESVCAQVYHPLHNKGMDRLFYRIRTRFGANNVPMDDILRRLIEWKRAGKATVVGYIADQAPWFNSHLFLDFLHHDTGVYTGPERISRFLDAQVYYCHLSRPRRGYYTLRFIPITTTPKKEETFAISRRYFHLLERNIMEAPQYWLWSHRRWKRSRQDFLDYWGDKADEQLSHL